MLNRKIRNLVLTGITIVSAVLLTALGATSASATTTVAATPGHADVATATAAAAASATPDSTLPNCNTANPRWACVQVFGNGTFISSMNGWAHNATGIDLSGDFFWNELYYDSHDVKPAGGAYTYIPIENCSFTSFPINGNSPNCHWAPDRNEPAGYYCDALWQSIGGPALWNWKCVDVHS